MVGKGGLETVECRTAGSIRIGLVVAMSFVRIAVAASCWVREAGCLRVAGWVGLVEVARLDSYVFI